MKYLGRFALILTFIFVCLVFWASFNKGKTLANQTRFTTITGQEISLQDLRGKPVLVTFWATTCASCMAEIPHLIDLYQRYHAKGFELIAVAMAYDPPNQVVNMAKAKNLPYPIALDIDSQHANNFGGIWATPTSYLINTDGSIGWHTVGMFEPEKLAALVEQQLNR